MVKRHPPEWAKYAAAEHLAAVWHDGLAKQDAWDLAADAFFAAN
jgi:hypothetical protein